MKVTLGDGILPVFSRLFVAVVRFMRGYIMDTKRSKDEAFVVKVPLQDVKRRRR